MHLYTRCTLFLVYQIIFNGCFRQIVLQICLLHLDHLVSLWQLSVTNIVFGFQTIADIIRTCLGPKAMLKVSLAHSLLSHLITSLK